MTAYVVQRLLFAVLVIFGVSVISFFLTFLSGDPAELMLPPGATAEQIGQLPARVGLRRSDHRPVRPLPEPGGPG